MSETRTNPCAAFRLALLLCLLAVATVASAGDAPTAREPLAPLVDRMLSAGGPTEPGLTDRIMAAVAADPGGALADLLPRLGEPSLSPGQLAGLLWAVALTRDPAATAPVAKALAGKSSPSLLALACETILTLGGPDAGPALMDLFGRAEDPDTSFLLLDALSQVKHEPALNAMGSLLANPEGLGMPMQLVFGKMGDAGVPYLIGRLDDPDWRVRANAATLLGAWLAAPEAAGELEKHALAEQNSDARTAMLDALERTLGTPAAMEAAFTRLAAGEDGPVARYARETLGNLPAIRESVGRWRAGKRDDRGAFEEAYAASLSSRSVMGREAVLESTSVAGDEPRLKALREIVLRRKDAAAFDSYMTLTRVIVMNRALAGK